MKRSDERAIPEGKIAYLGVFAGCHHDFSPNVVAARDGLRIHGHAGGYCGDTGDAVGHYGCGVALYQRGTGEPRESAALRRGRSSAGLDEDQVRAQSLDTVGYALLRALPDGDQHDDRADADNQPKGSQRTPQPVGENRAHGDLNGVGHTH